MARFRRPRLLPLPRLLALLALLLCLLSTLRPVRGGEGAHRAAATFATTALAATLTTAILQLGLLAPLTPVFASEAGCIAECASANRTHTEPLNRRGHPYAVAQFPTAQSGFCALGCRLLYVRNATLVGCRAQCSATYLYNVTVGYSDMAEVAKSECFDGCAVALRQCQAGYYCSSEAMLPCPPGTYREDSSNSTVSDSGSGSNSSTSSSACVSCPAGRFRASTKGRDLDSCEKCPAGRFGSQPGAVLQSDCARCPAGRFAPEEGMEECKCITTDSCDSALANSFQDTVPFEGRW